MRDRLIELLDTNCGYVEEQKAETLADEIIADGWMRPPCNVGDKLYKLMQAGGRKVVATYEVIAIQSSRKGEWVVMYKGKGSVIGHQSNITEIGKTLFLSQEEAKQALKGGEG